MAGNNDAEGMKREAARRAVEFVEPGMRLGLGTGTTARHFVDLLGERVASGLKVRCVATSEATLNQANGLGIPMTTLDEMPELDLTVDGADEIDPELRLIKGGGGALLREKIVAAASRRMAVIADVSKLVSRLGAFPLPVEVVPFGFAATRRHIEKAVEKSWPFCRDRFARRRLAFRDRWRPLHPRLRTRRYSRPGKTGLGALRYSGGGRTWLVHRLCPGRVRRHRNGRRNARPALIL